MKAAASKPANVALFGSPNSGKTSLFNALTGGREKVGNYPGVTVEKVTGPLQLPDGVSVLLDIPGLYSLHALSMDETVARDALLGPDRPELLVFLIDALNLERCLFLLSQTAEIGVPIVAALTMNDLAAKEGRRVDPEALAARLGFPVVEVVSHRGQGVEQLRTAIAGGLRLRQPPALVLGDPTGVRDAVARLHQGDPSRSENEWRRLLLASEAEEIPGLATERTQLFGAHLSPRSLDAQIRYSWAASIAKDTIQWAGSSKIPNLTEKIDRVLTHRVWGIGIFVGLMYLLFLSIYTLASPLMDWIEQGIGWLQGAVGPSLASMPAVQSLVVDGVIGGVGSALVFLPQILILFALIGALEGSGYLARASFLMDRAFGWCGLNGRAFIPLLSSFACAVPGIMAARVMPDSRSRLAVALVAPLMSCSARLPVYVLMIGAFIEPQFGAFWAGLTLFLMHFVGLAVAVPVMLLLNRTALKGPRLPFVMEMPRYQWPRLREVALMVWTRGLDFLKTAATIIVAMAILIWAALYFPRSDEAYATYQADHQALPAAHRESVSEERYLEMRQRADSYLGRFGRALEPVFIPAGFDWRLTTAILAAFPAREVVVPAMGILFNAGADVDEGSDDLRQALARATWPDGRPLLTIWTGIGLMVFFALCCQCMATLAVIKRETGSWKWPAFTFAYMTGLAWLAAVAIHQIGRAFGG